MDREILPFFLLLIIIINNKRNVVFLFMHEQKGNQSFPKTCHNKVHRWEIYVIVSIYMLSYLYNAVWLS